MLKKLLCKKATVGMASFLNKFGFEFVIEDGNITNVLQVRSSKEK